uniref:Tetraspanin n=1 Tax=Maylandia zebra TaxID=106582 RepID=A0A3P9CG20_9CICH
QRLSGVALITIGVLQYSTYSDIGTFTGSNLSKIAIVLIAVGVIIAFVSLLGHIGAFFNSSSMVALSLSLQFKCCGADSYADWSQSVGWEKHDAVPDSCCVVKSEGCGQDKEKAHKKGCLWAISVFLLKNLVWVGAVCIALGVTEVSFCNFPLLTFNCEAKCSHCKSKCHITVRNDHFKCQSSTLTY